MEDNRINVSEKYAFEDASMEKIDLFRFIADIWKGLKSGWWIPMIPALLVGIWFYVRADRSYTPYYQTSAAVYVDMASGESSSYQNMLNASQMVTVFPYLLQNGVLTDALEGKLGTDELPGSISLSVNENTNLLTFTVSGSDPQKTYELLQAVIEIYPETLEYIVGPTRFTVFRDMGVPEEPANTRPSEISFIRSAGRKAATVYLAVLLLVLLYGLSIRTISTTNAIKQYLNAVYLGSLPSVKFKKRSNQQRNQLTVDNLRVPYGFEESIRTVRTRFEREAESKNSRIVLVTSTVPGEGKTTVAVNLAISLAQKKHKVLLVDGDMRHPSLNTTLQLDERMEGLSGVLTGKAKVEDVIIRLPDSGLYVITAGNTTHRSTDLLSSGAMKDFLDQVRDYAEYIIVDTPPVMVLGDSVALGKYVDGCVYVVRCDQARRHMILDGFSQITESGCPVLGTVLNDADESSTGYGSYYSSYGKYGRYGGYGRYGKYGHGRYGYGDRIKPD